MNENNEDEDDSFNVIIHDKLIGLPCPLFDTDFRYLSANSLPVYKLGPPLKGPSILFT